MSVEAEDFCITHARRCSRILTSDGAYTGRNVLKFCDNDVLNSCGPESITEEHEGVIHLLRWVKESYVDFSADSRVVMNEQTVYWVKWSKIDTSPKHQFTLLVFSVEEQRLQTIQITLARAWTSSSDVENKKQQTWGWFKVFLDHKQLSHTFTWFFGLSIICFPVPSIYYTCFLLKLSLWNALRSMHGLLCEAHCNL